MNASYIRQKARRMTDRDARYEYTRLCAHADRHGGALMDDDAALLNLLAIRLGKKIEWQRIDLTTIPATIKEGYFGN